MSDSLRAAEEARERNVGLEYEDSLEGPQEAVQEPLTRFVVEVYGTAPQTHANAVWMHETLQGVFGEVEENLNAGMFPPWLSAKVKEITE